MLGIRTMYTENSFSFCENYSAIMNTGMLLILYPRTQYDACHHDYDESFTVLIPFLSVFVQSQCLRPTDSIGTPPRKQFAAKYMALTLHPF